MLSIPRWEWISCEENMVWRPDLKNLKEGVVNNFIKTNGGKFFRQKGGNYPHVQGI